MTVYGIHASHEQIDPRTLLGNMRAAEQAGFTAAMCSDHLAPWSARQGESGQAWAWLGAAMEATTMSFGMVNAPGQRYHPVIVAQAVATLAAMNPGRFWVALGSGQLMNEHVTGDRWPSKADRTERLIECIGIIRALLAGEEVTHAGHVTVDRARVWSLPSVQPLLVGAAVTEATAARLAPHVDALITISQPPAVLERMIAAYRGAGGRGEVLVQAQVSLAPTIDEARAIAMDQWRTNVLPPVVSWDLDSPEQYDAIAEHIGLEAVTDAVLTTDDPGRLAALLQDYEALGVDRVYLHHVGRDQRHFLEVAADRLLPKAVA